MASEHVRKYLDRIESQHRGRLRFMEHTETLLEMIDGAYDVIREMPDDFNIETAVGKQLDVIGKRVGAFRKVEIPDSAYYGTELNDEEFRAYIYSRIFRNHWDGTAETFQKVWDCTLGKIIDAEYFDNQDMTVTISISGSISNIILAMILAGEIIPKPACVGYIISTDNTSIDIIVSADTAHYEHNDNLYVWDETITAPDYGSNWMPVWSYVLSHSAPPLILQNIPAVQEIIQKFLDRHADE